MMYRLTDLPVGATGDIAGIGEIGLLRQGLYEVMARSGSRITVNHKNRRRRMVVISFKDLKLSLPWRQASAIEVENPA